jgi:hypothetical protein
MTSKARLCWNTLPVCTVRSCTISRRLSESDGCRTTELVDVCAGMQLCRPGGMWTKFTARRRWHSLLIPSKENMQLRTLVGHFQCFGQEAAFLASRAVMTHKLSHAVHVSDSSFPH